MSGYNDLLNLGAYEPSLDAAGSEYPPLPPIMSQSGAWTTSLQPPFGSTDGDTAAQLQTDVDFAPSVVAESLGAGRGHAPTLHGVAKHVCTVCLGPFRTDSALHQHAKDTGHQAYKCKCGTGFNKHSALKRHIDTKDAPKTFACTLCDDSFTRKDKLKDHCRLYHKVKDHRLQALFNSQQTRPRAAASRRRRAPVPLAAASSGSASTGQQYGNFPAGPLAMTSPFVPVSSFDSAADLFTSALAPSEDISGLAGDFLGDETWAVGFDGFNS